MGTATNLPPHGNGRLGPVPGLPQSWLPSPRALPRAGCLQPLSLTWSWPRGDLRQALVPAWEEEEDGAGVPGSTQGGEPGLILQAEAAQERSGRGNVLSAGYQQTSAAARGDDTTPCNLAACLPGFIAQPETKTELLVPGRMASPAKPLHGSRLTHFLKHERRSNGICEQSPAHTRSYAESARLLQSQL